MENETIVTQDNKAHHGTEDINESRKSMVKKNVFPLLHPS